MQKKCDEIDFFPLSKLRIRVVCTYRQDADSGHERNLIVARMVTTKDGNGHPLDEDTDQHQDDVNGTTLKD